MRAAAAAAAAAAAVLGAAAAARAGVAAATEARSGSKEHASIGLQVLTKPVQQRRLGGFVIEIATLSIQ